jgi:NTE family protein
LLSLKSVYNYRSCGKGIFMLLSVHSGMTLVVKKRAVWPRATEGNEMSNPSILILQGGGALGAYECGVYQALSDRLENLAVVAGTSIGAVNASIIAKHYHDNDQGRAALKHFWTEVLANPSFPFFFPVPGALPRWNAILTSTMLGHPHMFVPQLGKWEPFFPLFPTSFSSSHPLEQTMTRHFGEYGPGKAEPRLILTAVDIETGASKAFDSWNECLTAKQVVASGSLPPGYPAKEVDGQFYWDGGLWSNTPLPEVLNALQESPDQAWSAECEYDVYIVDVFPSQSQVPRNGLQVSRRFFELIFADKTVFDKKSAEWVNQYIKLVRTLELHQDALPPDVVRELIEDHLPRIENRAILTITQIKRTALPYEEISSGADFSPERITALIAQGYRDAKHQLPPEQQAKKPQVKEPAVEQLDGTASSSIESGPSRG